MRLGVIGSGVAVLGSAAFGALAPSAGAASGQARATPTYNSTASAEVNHLVVGDARLRALGVTATNANSPQDDKIALKVEDLNNVPVLGPAFGAAISNINDLASVHADASASGTSHACATTLEASCDGTPSPVTLKIDLYALAEKIGGVPTIDNLFEHYLVLTLQGPAASCAVGPAGFTPWFSGHVIQPEATAEIEDGSGKVDGSAVTLSGGDDVWSRLINTGAVTHLAPELETFASEAPLNLTLALGKKKPPAKSDSKVEATSGLLGLSSGEHALLEVGGAKATCGPNTLANSTKPQAGGEKPLGGIQSDEGRSSIPAVSWRALSGMP